MDTRGTRPDRDDALKETPDPNERPETPREMDLDESADLPREAPDVDESADVPRETPAIGELHGATKHTIDRLGSLYSMEASAARSYDMALASSCVSPYREAFGLNRNSHEERIRLLRDRIQRAGGQLPQTPNISDSLLELMGDAAMTLSASSALHVLERREERWLNEYNRALNDLQEQTRQFVEEELLPRQLQSHGALQAFKQSN